MYSNLIGKARNLVVEITLRSTQLKLAGKINEVDEVFVELLVWANTATGKFAMDRETYQRADKGESGWQEDRILVNIADISVIA